MHHFTFEKSLKHVWCKFCLKMSNLILLWKTRNVWLNFTWLGISLGMGVNYLYVPMSHQREVPCSLMLFNCAGKYCKLLPTIFLMEGNVFRFSWMCNFNFLTMISGFQSCFSLNKTTIYDSNFIRCVTIHPDEKRTELSTLDPAAGFQLVSPVGNMFEKYIEYNKYDILNDIPGKYFSSQSVFWEIRQNKIYSLDSKRGNNRIYSDGCVS